MANILVDTCVFIRLEGIYKDTFNCILETYDVICTTPEILREYKGRSSSSILFHLQPFLQKLKNKKKLAHFKTSYISARVRRHQNSRNINYPPHNKDRKWVNTAIAIRAEYIISTNVHLLNLVPNRYNDESTETIEPSQYTVIRCSNDDE